MLASTDLASAPTPNAGSRLPDPRADERSQSGTSSFNQVFASTTADADNSSDSPQTDTGAKSNVDPVAKQDATQPAVEALNSDSTEAPPVAGAKRRPLPTGAARPDTSLRGGSRVASDGSGTNSSSLLMLLGTPVTSPADGRPAEAAAGSNDSQTANGSSSGKLAADATVGAQSKAAPSLDGLAFALRLRPADKSNGTAAGGQESDAGAGGSRASATATSFADQLQALDGKAAASEKTSPAITPSTTLDPPVVAVPQAAPPSVAEKPAIEQPGWTAPAAEPVVSSNEPVRSVRVQVAGEGSARVDLTMVERAGALSVSVRSADSNLTHALQQHLPDLNARLTGEHYETELWIPRAEAPSAAGGAGKQADGSASGGSGGQSQNSNSQQQGDGQPGKRQDQAPDWLEQLAAFGRTSRIRSEYLWVQ